jgi:hypothetical protein
MGAADMYTTIIQNLGKTIYTKSVPRVFVTFPEVTERLRHDVG